MRVLNNIFSSIPALVKFKILSRIKYMAKQCAICEKKSAMAGKLNKLRGKYNPAPKKRRYPNLQWVKIPIGTEGKKYQQFIGKRILACTKCIKAMGKAK